MLATTQRILPAGNVPDVPKLLAKAEEAKLEIDPIDGPGVERMVNGLYEIEPAVVSRVKQILASK
jgi:hypothetical protein